MDLVSMLITRILKLKFVISLKFRDDLSVLRTESIRRSMRFQFVKDFALFLQDLLLSVVLFDHLERFSDLVLLSP